MNTARRFWARYALVASLAIPLAAVVCLGGAPVAAWTWITMLACAALAVLLAGAVRDGIKLPWRPLLWPAVGFGALATAQYLAGWTLDSAATLNGILHLAGCGCELYLALFAFREERNVKSGGVVLWIFCGALGAEALAQFFSAGRFIYWRRDTRYATPIGPFIYHNHFAGCMDLLLPVAIAVALGTRRRRHDPLWLARARRGILPALALAAVVVSQSRGGVFALMVEAAVAVALFWPRLRRDAGLRKRALFAALALLAFASLAGWRPLLARLSHLDYHDVSAIDRARVAETCLLIWRDHPWLGAGFNTFAQIYPAYQSFDSGMRWTEAHNEYAQALAETGLLGAAAVIAFALLLAAAGAVAVRRAGESAANLRIAALIGAAGFLFHSFGDFQFHSPANALLFFLFAGMVAAAGRTKPAAAPAPRSQPAFAGVGRDAAALNGDQETAAGGI